MKPAWLLALVLMSLSAHAEMSADSSGAPLSVAPETATPAWRELIGPTVSLRGSYWSDDKRLTDDRGFAVGAAWLELRPQEISGVRSYFSGYFSGEDLHRTPVWSGDVREAYLEKSAGDFDFRVGRQILVWGRADKLNPTDSLTVRDFRRLTTDDEEQRLGLFATRATWNLGAFRASAIWEPEWRSPGLPIPPLGSGVSLTDEAPGGAAAIQYGLKVDRSGGDVDFSASYFNGFSRTPDLDLIAAGPTGVALGLRYSRVQILGADFATAWNGIGLRGESAYTLTPDPSGTDPLIQNPALFTVLGIEKSPFENLNFNIQYLNRWVQAWSDPEAASGPSARLLAETEAVNTQQAVRMNHGVSVRPSYKLLNETLELEVAWVRWFTTQEQLVRPKITYAFSDHVKAVAGGEIYSGPAESFLGRLHDASALFTELRLAF